MKHGVISVISISLAGALVLSGCSSRPDFAKLDDVQELTQQEVIDYYAKQMSYDNIVERAADKTVDIQYNSVPENMQGILSDAAKKILDLQQSNNGYAADMSTDMHEYIKLTLDDMVLTNTVVKNLRETDGYYFITAESDVKPNQTGTFKDEANYVGIDGVIIEDYKGNPMIDSGFLKVALDKVNAYQAALGKPAFADYGDNLNKAPQIPLPSETEPTLPETDLGGNQVIGSDTPEETTAAETETTEAQTETTETEAETSPAETTQSEQPQSNEDNSTSYCDSIRKLSYDVNLFNKVAGTAIQSIAATPDLSMVYNVAPESGDLSGYGIYPGGAYGLKDFGYDRNNTTGKIDIVYVFKQNDNDRNTLDYKYAYVESYRSNIEMKDNNIVIADFINTELNKIIERADRVINDDNVNGIMNQSIFESSDLALKNVMWRNHSNLLTYISKIDKVLDRKNKVYLVDLERTTEESAKGCPSIGKFTDKYYAVIRQVGTEFKINDMVWVSRTTDRAPEPDVDSSSIKRLTSLNLAGEVPSSSKAGIEDLMKFVYLTATARTAVPKNDGTDDKVGLYDLFDTDRTLLSKEKDEYIKSQMVGRVMKHGKDVPCSVTGRVDEWLGGYNDQVELTTEEFYDYSTLNEGTYVKSYYLVSHYGTSWVIDDIKVIEEKDVTGDEYNDMKAKFSGSKPVNTVPETSSENTESTSN